jgi:hypothetical protein
MARKWIAGAIEHPGALTRKAKAAGQSTMAYAREHEHDEGTTGKQARLALTLRGFHGRRKSVGQRQRERKAA